MATINNHLRVLLVHGSEEMRAPIKERLEENGFPVCCVANGLDAMFMSRTEQFAIIISGLELPKISGFEMVRTLRNELSNADTPVIFISTGDEGPATIGLASKLNSILMLPEVILTSIGKMHIDSVPILGRL